MIGSLWNEPRTDPVDGISSATRRIPSIPHLALALLVALAAGPISAQEAAVDDAELQRVRARIQVPEGWSVELAAHEPALEHPVCFCFDDEGALYVAETHRHHEGVLDIRNHRDWLDQDYAARTVEDRLALMRERDAARADWYRGADERVRKLRDLDGDGSFETATLFAGEFRDPADGIGAGLIAHGGHVYFACIPHLWQLTDADGDGIAEGRRSLHQGYGVHIGFLGHDLHGLCVGPDGRLYFSIGDRGLHVETADGRVVSAPDTGCVLRCEPDGSDLEIFAEGLRNPQELAFDEWGDLFTGDNNCDGGDLARWVHVLPGSDSGWRVGYQWNDRHDRRGPWNAEKLWHTAHEGQPAYLWPPLAHVGAGPSGLTYLPDVDEPGRGRFLLCDFRGDEQRSGIHSVRVQRKGASFEVTQAEPLVWKVLATDVELGLDGDLYVSDWVHGWDKNNKGRIWRIRPPERSWAIAEDLRAIGPQATVEALIQRFDERDPRLRQRAQWELASRGSAAMPALVGTLRDDGRALLARVHALWTIGQIARRSRGAGIGAVRQAANSPIAEIRVQAARVLGDLRDAASASRLIRLLSHESARVRSSAAIALQRLADPRALGPLCKLLADNAGADLALRHSAVYALSALPESVLETRIDSTEREVRLGILLALRRQASRLVWRFLEDEDSLLVQEAALAINDRPIEVVMPALADALATGPMKRPFVLRALNANDRVGGPEQRRKLELFAHRGDVQTEWRLEALRILEEWGEPQLRDRVTNAHRPLPPRSAAGAADVADRLVRDLLDNGSPRFRHAAARLAARHPDLGFDELLAERVRLDRSVDVRRAALAALPANAGVVLENAISAALETDSEPLRADARARLAKLSPERALPVLRQVLEDGDVRERQRALRALGSLGEVSRTVLLEWLEHASNGRLPDELALDLTVAAEQNGSTDVRAALERWIAAETTEFGMYAGCALGGDAERGRAVFEKTESQCLRCHRIGAEGAGDAGPDLGGVGERLAADELLRSLLDPDADIAEGYRFELLFLRSGLQLEGAVVTENERELVVRVADEPPHSIALVDIEERRPGRSSMPRDLTDVLSRDEIRDLVAFLAQLKPASPKPGDEGPR